MELGDVRNLLTFLRERKAHMMNGWIGVTDNEWFDFLSRRSGIDEVNLRHLHGDGDDHKIIIYYPTPRSRADR
jgi:hypothetical protein